MLGGIWLHGVVALGVSVVAGVSVVVGVGLGVSVYVHATCCLTAFPLPCVWGFLGTLWTSLSLAIIAANIVTVAYALGYSENISFNVKLFKFLAHLKSCAI